MSSVGVADNKHLHTVFHMLGAVLSLHRLILTHPDDTMSVTLILQKSKLRHGAPDCPFIRSRFLQAPQHVAMEKNKGSEVQLPGFKLWLSHLSHMATGKS